MYAKPILSLNVSRGWMGIALSLLIVAVAQVPVEAYTKTCAPHGVRGHGFDKGLPFLYRGDDRFKLAKEARARGSFRAIKDWEKQARVKYPNFSAKWKDASKHFVACEFQEEADNDDRNDLETGWAKCYADAVPCRDSIPNLKLQLKPKVFKQQ